jgi:hypothetical protein
MLNDTWRSEYGKIGLAEAVDEIPVADINNSLY